MCNLTNDVPQVRLHQSPTILHGLTRWLGFRLGCDTAEECKITLVAAVAISCSLKLQSRLNR
jgi:hypothetical protein